MLRRLIKTAAARTLAWSRATSLFEAWSPFSRGPLVLGYHRVVEDLRVASGLSILPMLITTGTLERQLDWVGRRFRFVPLDELADRLERGEPGDSLAAVTFDDGYRDVYDCAFPLLRRKGIPSAVFVVTDFAGTKRLPVHDHLYVLLSAAFVNTHKRALPIEPLLREIGLPREPPTFPRGPWSPYTATRALLRERSSGEIRHVIALLESEVPLTNGVRRSFQSLTWPMMKELQQGGVTIGSHTRSHILLTNEAPARVDEEVVGSRRILEERLRTPIRHFAYPDGMFNAPAVRAVARAGYRCAFTSCMHRDSQHPLLTIPRLLLWEGSCRDSFSSFSPAIMQCHVSGVFRHKSACGPGQHAETGSDTDSQTPGAGMPGATVRRMPTGGSSLETPVAAPMNASRRRAPIVHRDHERL
jgi:peptidoglycan/xylan/chitin deacetylase (PgdA/CDA1 family)